MRLLYPHILEGDDFLVITDPDIVGNYTTWQHQCTQQQQPDPGVVGCVAGCAPSAVSETALRRAYWDDQHNQCTMGSASNNWQVWCSPLIVAHTPEGALS